MVDGSNLDLRLSLGRSVRQTLNVLQENTKLNARTQSRLATGKKIQGIRDGAVDYFRTISLKDRADLFAERKEEVDQGISALETHITSLESLRGFLGHLRGHIQNARAKPLEARIEFNDLFREVAEQISKLIIDTEYDGVNLLSSDRNILTIRFSDDEDSRLDIQGREVLGSNLSTGALFSFASLFHTSSHEVNFSAILFDDGVEFIGFSQLDTVSYADFLYNIVGDAQERVETIERSLGGRASILQARKDYLNRSSTQLLVGSEKISLANLDEEAVNSASLETSYQIGVTSLTNSKRAQQLLLQLLRD